MLTSVVVFPGSNCDRDVAVAVRNVTGQMPDMVWHGDAQISKTDLIILPGGFSYGDYLRSGAMAAHSPIMKDIVDKARGGTPVLGICNGFQILTETGLLPGILMPNASLKFICRNIYLKVERNDTIFTNQYSQNEIIKIPIANHDGNYFADDDTLNELEENNCVAFRYVGENGELGEQHNPNGSLNSIAGVFNKRGNILGLMPHPERLVEDILGGCDGRLMFESLLEALH